MGAPATLISLRDGVRDSCGDRKFQEEEKENDGKREKGKVVRGVVGWSGGTDWLAVSWGVCVCLQGKVTGGNRSNEV